jgi:hypothetical protein
MIGEKEVVEKIVELAKESGRQEMKIKNEADRPVEDTPDSINARDNKLQEMGRKFGELNREINALTSLFRNDK